MRSLTLANHSNFPGLGVNEHLASSCNNFYIFVAFCSSFPKPIAFTLAPKRLGSQSFNLLQAVQGLSNGFEPWNCEAWLSIQEDIKVSCIS
jgi:hypothetical protein